MIAKTKVLLNVRSSKDFDNASIVSVLPMGTDVDVKSKAKDWCELQSGNFVRTEFLTFAKTQKKKVTTKVTKEEK